MDKIISNTIGWTLIICGVLYAVCGSMHCDAARFIACCVCLLGGVTAMDNDKDIEKDSPDGDPVKESRRDSSH